LNILKRKALIECSRVFQMSIRLSTTFCLRGKPTAVYVGLANQTDRNTQRSRVSALRYKLDVQFMPCSVHC
jgi:hypothetical protein